MLNYGRVIAVLEEELGQAGAEAVSDAINQYLASVKVSDIPCTEDVIVLYSLAYAFDCSNLNHILPEFDCLRGKLRTLGDFISKDGGSIDDVSL